MLMKNNLPINWDKGFAYPETLLQGETPFVKHGKWYLVIWDAKERDQKIYDYSIDMCVLYDSVITA